MNISGVVVTVIPADFKRALSLLEASPVCDVHMTDDSHRIVVTLEGSDSSEEAPKLRTLQTMDYVISAEMVYSYAEEELSELRDAVEAGEVPAVLTDDEIRAEDIRYGGHDRHL